MRLEKYIGDIKDGDRFTHGGVEYVKAAQQSFCVYGKLYAVNAYEIKDDGSLMAVFFSETQPISQPVKFKDMEVGESFVYNGEKYTKITHFSGMLYYQDTEYPSEIVFNCVKEAHGGSCVKCCRLLANDFVKPI